jgi:hypothetical protein
VVTREHFKAKMKEMVRNFDGHDRAILRRVCVCVSLCPRGRLWSRALSSASRQTTARARRLSARSGPPTGRSGSVVCRRTARVPPPLPPGCIA